MKLDNSYLGSSIGLRGIHYARRQARKAQTLNHSIIAASLILGVITPACGNTSDQANTRSLWSSGDAGGASGSTAFTNEPDFTQVSCPNPDAGHCMSESISGVSTTNPTPNLTLYFWIRNTGTSGIFTVFSNITSDNGGKNYSETASFYVDAAASYEVTVVIPMYEDPTSPYDYTYTSSFPQSLQLSRSYSHYYADGPSITTMVEY